MRKSFYTVLKQTNIFELPKYIQILYQFLLQEKKKILFSI